MDILEDGVRWLVPGAVGKTVAFVFALTMAVGGMYVVYVRNYTAIAKWF